MVMTAQQGLLNDTHGIVYLKIIKMENSVLCIYYHSKKIKQGENR